MTMGLPRVGGLPSQGSFGVPVNRSPLRAYARARGQDSATSQGDTVTVTLDKAPLPGSIMLASWDAEKPSGGGTTNPDVYAIEQTGYRWGPLAQHGNIDQNYPYSELWIGYPIPGLVGSTSVTNSGARGGWRSMRVIEVPNIVGRIITAIGLNWANTDDFTTTWIAAPQDCLAIAWGAIDSGGVGNEPTASVNPTWSLIYAAGDGWMAVKPVPKGQVAAITTGTARSDFQVAAIAYMI